MLILRRTIKEQKEKNLVIKDALLKEMRKNQEKMPICIDTFIRVMVQMPCECAIHYSLSTQSTHQPMVLYQSCYEIYIVRKEKEP